MTTSMRVCVAHNDPWPWPLSSRSFSHDSAIKLLKYGTCCCVRPTGGGGGGGGGGVHNDLWPWPISFRSFSHDFAIKLLKLAHLTVSTPQHVQFWIDSFHICHIWSLAWEGLSCAMTWPIFSRSFSHDCYKIAKLWHILSCPPYSTNSSGWILSIFGTNDH